MRVTGWVTQYVVAGIFFLALDAAWLTVVARDRHEEELGPLLAEDPRLVAAVAFYLIFLAGLVFFVIHPAVTRGSWAYALGAGAGFGLVTYATWALTNVATLRGFPASLVPDELAWGTVLAGAVATLTWLVVQRLPAWART